MVKDNVVKVIECNLKHQDPFRLCAKFSTIISSKSNFVMAGEVVKGMIEVYLILSM